MNDVLSPKELKRICDEDLFAEYTPEKILFDAKHNFDLLKSTPSFGEETLGIYLQIFEKLAAQNFIPAIYELGRFYYKGEWWKPLDLEKSISYYQKAAALGHADAIYELSVLYSIGDGVEKNEEISLGLCKKAAELGHAQACYNMGIFYASGNGVEVNIQQALKCYQLASEAGHGKASATIGILYKSGEGIEKDEAKAERYFALSEEQGFAVKRFLLAEGIER